jgi:hypothetical protein
VQTFSHADHLATDGPFASAHKPSDRCPWARRPHLVGQRTDRMHTRAYKGLSFLHLERFRMTIQHRLWAMTLLSLSMTAFANDIGTLGSTPIVQTLRIDAQDVSFSSRTYFSLDLDSWFSAAAQSSKLSLAGTQVLGTEHFSMQVLNAANQVVMGTTALADALSIDSLQLTTGRYALLISGDTTGSLGGQLVWSLVATTAPGSGIEVIIPGVPEPSTLLLSMFALLPLWQVARKHALKSKLQAAVT